ncbi:MAG: phosphoribosylamine--glycine ligase [Chloroflexota bacterium]|nr:phosphoribosylamine--glycine ligase [Anaerolineae bacterium]
MRVLVVGAGGREHALAWALRRSPRVEELFVAPGNAGTDSVAVNVPIKASDIDGLTEWARGNEIDLTVVGPESPLALGIADRFGEVGLPVFGPSREAARIETSKVFSKVFMQEEGIPTADFEVFQDFDKATAYLQKCPFPLVVKADGLAGGKGVSVCHVRQEAEDALQVIMEDRVFGDAGTRVVIEECLTGQEVSVLAFSDGQTVMPMVTSQDHKAAYDGDKGPNTGGMGCYAPMSLMTPELLDEIQRRVLQPAVDGLRLRGLPYVGVLYAGMILTPTGPQALEFNCRFGDPETQVILPLLRTDLADVLEACVEGRLHEMTLRWSKEASVCVVIASGGYPKNYRTGYPISGLDEVADLPDVQVFHAGTALKDGMIVTAGGRVLGVSAWGDTLTQAINRAYCAVGRIRFRDQHFRHDIGQKAFTEGVGM